MALLTAACVVRACVCARVRVCVCVCVRACVRAWCVYYAVCGVRCVVVVVVVVCVCRG